MTVSQQDKSLCRVIGPLWAGFLFDIHVDLPFLSSAVILGLGFAISLAGSLHPPRKQAQVTQNG